MAAIVLANAPEGHTPPDVPRKDNGDLYDYFMSYENGRYLAYADDPVDLLDLLIPGYADSDEDDRIMARIRLALDVQTQAQALVLAAVPQEEIDSLKPWEHKVLVHEGGSSPHGWGAEAGEPVEAGSGETVDIWYSKVPLILVDTGYAPFTDVPRPLSALGDTRNEENLIWLRPSDEEDFLDSLALVNFIYFARRLND